MFILHVFESTIRIMAGALRTSINRKCQGEPRKNASKQIELIRSMLLFRQGFTVAYAGVRVRTAVVSNVFKGQNNTALNFLL